MEQYCESINSAVILLQIQQRESMSSSKSTRAMTEKYATTLKQMSI
ncbi:serine/threonine protein kinase [Fusarium oxysporum f. sp. conglutinans race 2 54008]|uniref:Serine/threonine protein kinase n=1 Tax=Fusarium oxysporum f. sp. conglutinans race 2 54008 TaxID=1089457 RepID=X0H3N5_FUSOX|nr:serine/threonine protein kinase [Fusarium oxysporum f. sp. conglutinans race 2 54008]